MCECYPPYKPGDTQLGGIKLDPIPLQISEFFFCIWTILYGTFLYGELLARMYGLAFLAAARLATLRQGIAALHFIALRRGSRVGFYVPHNAEIPKATFGVDFGAAGLSKRCYEIRD